MTTQSLDRKLVMRSLPDTDRSAVLCNRYALDDLENELRRWRTSAGNDGERASFGERWLTQGVTNEK